MRIRQRRRIGHTAPWSPHNLGSDLLAYWDQRYGVTTQGGSVSSWKDLVAGDDAVQATADNQPVDEDGQIVADAANDELTLAPVPSRFPTSTTPGWLWCLVDQTIPAAVTSEGVIAGWGNASTISRRVTRLVQVETGLSRAAFRSGSAVATNTLVDFSGRHTVVGKASGTEIQVDVDGIAGTPVAHTPATGTSRFRFFASATTSPSAFGGGGLLACLITRPLSSVNKSRLDAWCWERLAA